MTEPKFCATDADWAQRRLCSDESCIGVVGPDGCCKECGLPADSPAEPTSVPPEAESVSAAELVAEESETEPVVRERQSFARTPDESEDDWECRRLCVDEGCIGVVGPDGRCKECGRNCAEPESA